MDEMSNEDRYFLEREAEMRDNWRGELEAKAKTAAGHQAIGEKIGVNDEQLAKRIGALGFEGETAKLLHLMPLVAVAWADGSVSSNERKVIVQAAVAHGVEPDDAAGRMLASMLEQRPSATVLDQILAVLKDMLAAKGMHPTDVLQTCLDVAEASRGFMGFGEKISGNERGVIEQIAATFGDEAQQQVAQRLE